MGVRSLKIHRTSIIATTLLLVVGVVLVLVIFFREPAARTSESRSPEVARTFRHPLTGVLQETEVSGSPNVFAVMVENSSDAWPLSGVDQAFLVIEAPAEAAIPRLIAFFSEDQTVEKIGPVRSARPYFVQWANMFKALYVHVGGSDAALDLISSNGTFDLNQFWNDSFFWRASDRGAPHNVYTSTDLLRKALTDRQVKGKATEPVYGLPPRAEDAKALEACGEDAWEFAPQTDRYRKDWSFDREANVYRRTQGGLTHVASNVVIVQTDVSILDEVGRREIRTTGEGDGVLFQNGCGQKIRWQREAGNLYRLLHPATGAEIPWNWGTTWIEIPDADETIVRPIGSA